MSSGSGARDTLQEQPGRRSDHEREPGQTTIQTAYRVGRLRRVAYDDGQTERRFLVSIRARSKPLSASAGKMWPWETVCWSIRRARCGKRFRCSGGEGWKEKPDGFYRIPQGFCRAAAVWPSPLHSRGVTIAETGDGMMQRGAWHFACSGNYEKAVALSALSVGCARHMATPRYGGWPLGSWPSFHPIRRWIVRQTATRTRGTAAG